MNTLLNQIRARPANYTAASEKLYHALLSFLLGAVLGFLAKYFDGTPVLGDLGTLLGVWILIATLLAAWSPSPRSAALHVLLFFAAMLVVYYTYSMILFGFFPRYYFLVWGGLALLSPIAGAVAWYARGNGWPAALCAALPIALLLAEGRPFFYTRSFPYGFDLLAAVFLLVVLGHGAAQRFRTGLLAGALFVIFWQAHIFSLLFGGL